MSTPIYVNSPGIRLPEAPTASANALEQNDLLRQLLEIQKEQLAIARQQIQNADTVTRWRNFLQRWQSEFPDVGPACKQVLPVVERVYLSMMQELADRLRGPDADDLDSEFTLMEFLDKYGVRLNQLATVMGQLAPIADACPPPAAPAPKADDNAV
ncbi:MAG: hypothetical protein ACRCZF_19890 [Gemmataceae bacterium]